MRMQISTVIIAQNEAHRLAAAIGSASPISDEILVIDGGSQDCTAELAKELGCRVIFNQWPGFAPQRNFGAHNAKYDWVLILDADEILDDVLINELRRLRDVGSPNDLAYACARLSYFWGKPLPNEDKSQVRLYNRNTYKIANKLVHESPDVPKDRVKPVNGNIIHDGSQNLEHHIEKFNRYTSLDAQERILAGRQAVSYPRLIFRPAAVFANLYFRRQLFRLGMTGFVVCFFKLWYELVVEMKIYEKTSTKVRDRMEADSLKAAANEDD